MKKARIAVVACMFAVAVMCLGGCTKSTKRAIIKMPDGTIEKYDVVSCSAYDSGVVRMKLTDGRIIKVFIGNAVIIEEDD